MEAIVVIVVIAIIGGWAFKAGKRDCSRKGYYAGRKDGQRWYKRFLGRKQ